MDITILLWLQKLREAMGPAANVIAYLSDFLVFSALFVPFIWYWCTNKEDGKDVLLALAVSLFINQFLKVTFSVYRPWIRDPAITPSYTAMQFATGYSFPSAHTQICGTIYGYLAVKLYPKNKKLSALCILVILFTGFTRMFLGVHTPQDVLTGMAIAAVSVWGVLKANVFIEANPHYRKYFAITALILSVIGIAYAVNKSYPMDFVDGILVVDPVKMVADALLCIGIFFGIFWGNALEQKYLGFTQPAIRKEKIKRFVIGLVLVAVLFLAMKFLDLKVLRPGPEALVFGVAGGVFIMYLYPLLCMRHEARMSH